MLFPLLQNGMLSALPYIMTWVCSFPVGYLADWIARKRLLSKRDSRRLFTCVGFFGSGSCLIWLSFTGCHKEQVIAALCIAMGFYAGNYAGYFVRKRAGH